DAPGRGLVAGGAQPHRFGLVLVIADGVERQAKAARVEPAQSGERAGGEGEAEVVEERLASAESAGKERRHHATAGADEIPPARQLARRDAEAQRSDGEGVAAQAEDQIGRASCRERVEA